MLQHIVLRCCSIYIPMLHYIAYIICDVALKCFVLFGTGMWWGDGMRWGTRRRALCGRNSIRFYMIGQAGLRAARKADCILEDATTHVVWHCHSVHVCLNSRPGCVIHDHLTARASKGWCKAMVMDRLVPGPKVWQGARAGHRHRPDSGRRHCIVLRIIQLERSPWLIDHACTFEYSIRYDRAHDASACVCPTPRGPGTSCIIMLVVRTSSYKLAYSLDSPDHIYNARPASQKLPCYLSS
jgi:hypothetical protein